MTAATIAFLVALVSPIVLRPLLRKAGVIDVPNDRSSHSTPVLRGGGLSQACAIALAIGYLGVNATADSLPLLLAFLAACAAAASLGWLEDLSGLRIWARAGSQFLIGILAMSAAALGTGHNVGWGLLGGIALVGGINVVNFMDGVNGISSLHGIVAGASFVAIGYVDHAEWLVSIGVVLAAAFAAFMPWNLNGRTFLGDVGSYLLGGAIAMTIALGWMEGLSVVALASPMVVYVADAGTTLVSRILTGEEWYGAHRDHTYQRLSRAGASHIAVAVAVASASTITATAGFGAAHTDGISRIGFLTVIVLVIGIYTALRFRLGSLLNRVSLSAS